MAKKKTEKERKRKTKKTRRKKIKAVYAGSTVTSNTKEALNLYGKSRFGELVDGKITYSLSETLFLTGKNKMSVYEKSKRLGFEKLLSKLQKIDKRIETKYRVFKDLRERGYIVKTALKFGAEFRVYDKGIKPGEDHAKWILYPVKESDILTWHDFSAKNRVAHSTKKKLLIGIVDEEASVTYYEISWVKP